MALTQTDAALKVTRWLSKYYVEMIRSNKFRKYMSTSQNAIIQIQEELSKRKGHQVVFPLVNALRGAGVSGSSTLVGNEEAIKSDGLPVPVDYNRHAVAIDDAEKDKGTIDLLNAGKMLLDKWGKNLIRDQIITALMSKNGNAYFATQALNNAVYDTLASEADRDAWLLANGDRALFGAANSNTSTGDHSASLLNVDSTNDKMSPAIGRLAKRKAQRANPSFTPTTVNDEEEWFVMFLASNSFRDLSQDSEMRELNRDARNRGMNNPLFTSGDLVADGIIYRAIPEIPVLEGVGAAGIDVDMNFLCGIQAVGHAIARRPYSITNTEDYGFQNGVGVALRHGMAKMRFKDPTAPTRIVDNAVVTVYTSGVADA
ncbi:MAG: DUF4043 family protein [Planctomycetes bacterium]|nr:DUF4043 family protein [Planctomycetota bacterium]